MSQKKLIHISDLHLSQTRAYTYANWSAVLDYVNRTQPDLLINTGDFVLEEPDDVDDLAFGREQMEHLTVPWKALPGDHDMGGGPPQPRLRPEVPWLEHYGITEARRQHYLSLFENDRWALPFGDWYLIGFNDLMLESGFAAEDTQWQYLADQLREAGNRPVALFMHKPPCVVSLREDAYVTSAIPARARRRLLHMIEGTNVRLICAGHLHVYRTFHTLGISVVVAPTIRRGEDDYVSGIGLDVNGIVEYNFDGEGVEFRLVEPPGVTRPRFPTGIIKDWPQLPAETLNDD